MNLWELLTTDTSPWWASIVTFLLGLGSAHLLQRRSDRRADKIRREDLELNDKMRFEDEVRDRVEQANEAAVAMHANTLLIPSDPTSGQNDPLIWQENYAVLKKMSYRLDSIASRSVYEAADLLRSTALLLHYARTGEEFSNAQERFEKQREALQKALRTDLRIKD